MKLLTANIKARLIANWCKNSERIADNGMTIDFKPVVKLFTPDADCVWLLTELSPEEPDLAFGLADLGLGCPEIGNISLSEITSIRGELGLPVERDLWFSADRTLLAYAGEALGLGHIRA